MKNKEYDFYNEIKNWDFSDINYTKENFTNWDMYEILRNNVNKESKILDLGTGGGEKVIKYFPEAKEIIATDFSKEMIKTAKENLKKTDRKDITFRQMDNLNMNLKKNYFDVVVARNTKIDPKQIYEVLKEGGYLIVRGVDKYDCYELKKIFGYGQGYFDDTQISVKDYNNIINANFKNTELVFIHEREYYDNYESLYEFLKIVPILNDMNDKNNIDERKLSKYVEENIYNNKVRLLRRYYGIVAKK